MFEFVGVGDLHLGKLERVIPGAGNALVEAEFRKACDYAVRKTIKHVVLYGDIGDKARLSYSDHITLIRVMFDPKYKHLKFWLYLGNHDFDEDGRNSFELFQELLKFLRLLEQDIGKRIKIITKPLDTEIDGVKVRFLPYPNRQTSSKRLNFCHFDAVGGKRDNGKLIKAGEGVDTDDFCCIGHLHTPHRVRNMFFSGTLYQTNFGESLPKFFHHVRVDENLKRRVKYIRNRPGFTLNNLQIYTRKDLNKISESESDIYKLFVHDGVDIKPDDLKKYPNVIKINRFKDEKDLKVQLEEEWKAVDDIGTVFQPREDVKFFLTTKNVQKSLKRRVLQINDSILKEFFKGHEHEFR